MVDLLEHPVSTGTVGELTPTAGAAPPKAMPDIERHVEPRWPRRAKIVIAVLAVLALAGAFGTAWQSLADDPSTGDQAQVAELTGQRNALLVENGSLRTDVDGLEADNAALTTNNAQLAADNAELQADNVNLHAESNLVWAELARVQAANSVMSDQLDGTAAQVSQLANQVSDLQAANATITAERDALATTFPLLVDTSLVGVDVAGTYAVKWFPAYNWGLGDVLFLQTTDVVLSDTPEGWTQVAIPGLLTAGLFGTDGALSTLVETTAALPPVNGLARTARVAVTIYAGATLTAADGTTTVTQLGMSIAIAAAAVGDAPAGVALYGAALTPSA